MLGTFPTIEVSSRVWILHSSATTCRYGI